MRKKFIVCAHSNSVAIEKKFKDRIERLGFSWWHWIPGVWLIANENSNASPREIIDIVLNALGNSDALVIELPASNKNWAGYGAADAFNWLDDNW